MYTRFRFVPKSMTLNNLWARIKVIDSLNAARMAKYSLVIIFRRYIEWTTYSCAGALTYLLTYWLGSGRIKPAISPKRLMIKRKLLLTDYIVIHWLSIAAKMHEWRLSEIQGLVIDSINAAKMPKYSLAMTPTPSRVALCIIAVRSIRRHSCTYTLYLLTQLVRV